MKSIFKVVSVLLFSFGFILTAKAQDDNVNAPAEDEIVCTQVAENVFDCYVQPGAGTDEFEGEQNPYLDPEYGQEDLNREEMDRENQNEQQDPERDEFPEQSEDEFWTEPETPSNPSNPADPYYQEMNLPINI